MHRVPFLFLLLLSFEFAQAQGPFLAKPDSTISSDQALDYVVKKDLLSSVGLPFHAVLQVSPQKQDPAFEAKIELFWRSADSYHLTVESHDFGQTLTIDGGKVEEHDRGDFYPNWLENFVTALLTPIPRLGEMRGLNQPIGLGEHNFSCVTREKKNERGVGDDLVWESVCFEGTEAQLGFAINMSYNMEYHDFKGFHGHAIARTYIESTDDHARLEGVLTKLEDWNPDPALLNVATPTPAKDQIKTTLVSTLTEESMLESAPKDVQWPEMREGRTEGYMIVQARTDRTGQVRETSKHNSDNPGLESYGRLVALKYKFKPLIVDGVAQQMDMPLVLHFTTKLGKPIAELDDATSRRMITGCTLPRKISDPASAGQQISIQFQVNGDGKLMTLGSSDRKIPVLSLFAQFRGCHFERYTEDGAPAAYHANVTMTAK